MFEKILQSIEAPTPNINASSYGLIASIVA
jgi:hypothetical protein